MHKVKTLTLDQKIRKIATELKDTQILAKLAAGDMTATDAVYHNNCLSSFYNKYRRYVRKNTSNSASDIETQTNKATAFAELVTYIESFESTESKENHIFKLSDLNRMYTNRLQQLGTKSLSNSSHLKEKLLAAVPSLEEHSTEYETMVSFRKHLMHLGDYCSYMHFLVVTQSPTSTVWVKRQPLNCGCHNQRLYLCVRDSLNQKPISRKPILWSWRDLQYFFMPKHRPSNL